MDRGIVEAYWLDPAATVVVVFGAWLFSGALRLGFL